MMRSMLLTRKENADAKPRPLAAVTKHPFAHEKRGGVRRWVLVALLSLVMGMSGCRFKSRPYQPTSTSPPPVTTAAIPTATATTRVEQSMVTPLPTGTRVTWPLETAVSGPGAGQPRLLGSYVRPQDIPEYCEQLQQYHVRFTWMQVPWSLIEPQKGRFSWETADTVLQAALDCGLDVGVHVHARSNWATLPTPAYQGRTAPSTPPKDMDDYYSFLFNLASRYKGKVSRYSIEEEAHAEGGYFAGTPEQYMQMLETAHKAIHDADPDAIVQDSGLSSSAIGALYGYHLMDAGKTAETSQFLKKWYLHYAPTRSKGESFSFDSEADLQAFFANDQVQRLLRWVELLWSEHADDYDVQQIHYFGPWDAMPEMLDWLHGEMKARGTDKPIEFWEFGYGWDDVRTYDPEAHARDEAKLMAMAIGEGVLRALSWQFTDYVARNGHPGLVTARGPRPAAQSFGVTAEKLNGTTQSSRLDLGQGVWAYQCEKDAGTVFVLWSNEPVTVSLPVDAANVTVTDITGQTRLADPAALDVGISPIFVEVNG